MRLKRKKITKFIGFIAGFLLTACLYCNSALAVMVPFTPAVLQPRVDVRGTLIDHAAYKPFGEFASSSSYILMTGSHYFTGKELDNSTGLYYYGARYYNPSLGRFIQPDPIVKNVYDSQSLNPYSYCRNNPLRIADPTGMLGEDWSMGGLGDVFGGGYTNYTSSTSHTYSNIMGGVDYGYSNTFGSSWSTAPSYLTAMDFNFSTTQFFGMGLAVAQSGANTMWDFASTGVRNNINGGMQTFNDAISSMKDSMGSFSAGDAFKGALRFASAYTGALYKPLEANKFNTLWDNAAYNSWGSSLLSGARSGFQGLGIAINGLAMIDTGLNPNSPYSPDQCQTVIALKGLQGMGVTGAIGLGAGIGSVGGPIGTGVGAVIGGAFGDWATGKGIKSILQWAGYPEWQ